MKKYFRQFLMLFVLLVPAISSHADSNFWVEQAKSGSPRAQYNLGRMYLWGMDNLGIRQSDQQAYQWFLKSAEQGYAPAQFEVGMALKFGRGVNADKVASQGWLQKAAAQGYKGDESAPARSVGGHHGSKSGKKIDTSIPPGELLGLLAGLSVDSVVHSITNVQFFNGWWSWWLGAIGLGFVTVGFWYANRVTLGVSSSWDRIVGWRDDLKLAEADQLMRATPADDLAAAMMAETLAEFGDEMMGQMDQDFGGQTSSATTSRRPERTRWTVHITFLMAFVVGGFLGYAPAGDWHLHTDMGPEFVRLFGDGPESLVVLLIGGILVGFGTRLGGGCTSGHALSGCSRFQIGSFVATATFFGTAIVVSILLNMFLL